MRDRIDAETSLLTRRRLLELTGAGAAALASGSALVGCSSGTESPSGAESGGTPRRGGSLRVGLIAGSAKDSLDAGRAVTEADIAFQSQIYDGLLEHDPHYRVRPSLAETVEPSNDARTWTIRIREDVVFHNGQPFTAEDVKYTFARITDPEEPGAAAARLTALDRDRMEVLDKHTLRLQFRSPYVAFRDVLAEGGTAGVRVIPRGYDPKQPVGTGAFKVKSFDPGRRGVFVRNRQYWREGQPYLDEVVLIDYPDDAARVNALRSGQVDAIAALPTSQVKVIQADQKFRVIHSETGSWNPITMRVDRAPFDDLRVRQAFRLFADRQQLVQQVLSGYGKQANDLYARYDPAYTSDLPQREADLDQARSLLKQARQDGVTVELVTSPVATGLVPAAEAFVRHAEQAGVKVQLRRVEPSTFFDRFFLKSTLSQSYWGTRNYLLQAAASMMPGSPYNETHWHDERWLKIVQQAMGELDDAKREEMIHDAQKIEHTSGGYLNWGWYDKVDATTTNVGGIVPDRSGFSLSSYQLRRAWLRT